MDLFSVKDQVVVIAGGAGYLGREIALYLADQGARVHVLDRDPEGLQVLAAGAAPVSGHLTDLGSETDIRQSLEAVMEARGRVDVLINCAALKSKAFFSSLDDFSLEDWEQVMQVNLTSFFLTAREVSRVMKAQGGGSIINFSSIYGISGPDERIYEGTSILTPPVYAASKGGVVGFTRFLATTLAAHGIRANVLTPGGIQDRQDPGFIARYASRCPMGRMGTPQDLLGGVHFLASKASAYVTGQNLIIDGGWTAW